MGDNDLSYSYRDSGITIRKDENKLVVDFKGKKSEYLLDSVYKIILTKSKTSLRFLLFGTLTGLVGIILLIHGLMLISKGGLGEAIAGLIFLSFSFISFKVGVIPRYFLGIAFTKGNKSIKVKKSPELGTFIRNANSLLKKKQPNSENGMLVGSSYDYFGGKI